MLDKQQVINDTQAWVDKAVIGLNLCPFAKAVQIKGQVRYVVSEATTVEQLLYALAAELNHLHDTPADETDTTLLIHPQVLGDFLDYNDFLEAADALVEEIGLEGEIQVASFHPDYQFDGTSADDITNYSNRSPYPTLHLLREDSIDRAVEAFPEADAIYETNMKTLEKLGVEGWKRLGLKV
jgi:uncharacterized protein